MILQSQPVRSAVLMILGLGAGLAACSPADMVDKMGRRTAETVVLPVVAQYLPGAPAQQATICIVEGASAADIQALVRDVAVSTGSSTVATVLRIAEQPNTLACLAAAL